MAALVAAMFVAPAARSSPMAVLRRVAMAWGADPVQAVLDDTARHGLTVRGATGIQICSERA